MIAALKDYFDEALIPYLHDLKDYFTDICKMLIG